MQPEPQTYRQAVTPPSEAHCELHTRLRQVYDVDVDDMIDLFGRSEKNGARRGTTPRQQLFDIKQFYFYQFLKYQQKYQQIEKSHRF